MTDNLSNVLNPTATETIRPEVQQTPETKTPASPDNVNSIAPDVKEDAGRIVDKRTGHEKLDAVSSIADAFTQKANEEEGEFIRGVENKHNPEKPTS